MVVTREELLRPRARRYKTVPVMGREFRIQSLFDSEMIAIRESFVDKRGNIVRSKGKRIQQLLVGNCLVDEQNARLVSDEDVFNGALDTLDGGEIAKLYSECKEFTGFLGDSEWDAIEDASKNSDDASTSDSTVR